MGTMGISGNAVAERRRVTAVVETLAAMQQHGESLGELAHDARNMVTALGLYCDLLEEPGVLASAHRHYASELRLLAEASRCLVEKISRLDGGETQAGEAGKVVSPFQGRPFAGSAQAGAIGAEPLSGALIESFREELLASRGLLAAIPGPGVSVVVHADGGAWPVRMSGENLIRALVNLVKNSAESIGGEGSIALHLSEKIDRHGNPRCLLLSVEDTGCGIANGLLEKVFDAGFSTRAAAEGDAGWPSGHHGLGLSITRSIVEAAGGRIHAENRTPKGTRFVMELPIRNG